MSATENKAIAKTTAPENDTAAPKDGVDSFGWLPCELTLEIPVPSFTVGNLIKLEKGSIVETALHHTSDIPLRANKQLIAWTEFEVVGDNLAVRVTELA
jgi:flagellar motor switch/type III secretory pathway protein FliN